MSNHQFWKKSMGELVPDIMAWANPVSVADALRMMTHLRDATYFMCALVYIDTIDDVAEIPKERLSADATDAKIMKQSVQTYVQLENAKYKLDVLVGLENALRAQREIMGRYPGLPAEKWAELAARTTQYWPPDVGKDARFGLAAENALLPYMKLGEPRGSALNRLLNELTKLRATVAGKRKKEKKRG